MFLIEPNGFYSRDDLAEMLGDADVDTFISRLGARKVVRRFWRGKDLLEAYDKAPALPGRGADRGGAELPAPSNKGNRSRRKGAREETAPGALLDAYREELKAKMRGNG